MNDSPETLLALYRWWRDIGNDILLGGILLEIFIDAFWPEDWRGLRSKPVAAVLAGIIVLAGIGLERKFSDKADDVSDDIRGAQQSKIATLEEEAGKLRDTNLVLEVLLEQLRRGSVSRGIDEKAFSDALRDAPKSYVQIFFVPYSPDGRWLGMQFFDALNDAGWKADPPIPLTDDAKIFPTYPKEFRTDAFTIGVSVIGGKAESTPLTSAKNLDVSRSALVRAISAQLPWPVSVGSDESMPLDRLKIVIGVKAQAQIAPGPGANLMPPTVAAPATPGRP